MKERVQKEKVNLALQDLAVASRRSFSEDEDGGQRMVRIQMVGSFHSCFDDIGNDKAEDWQQTTDGTGKDQEFLISFY